MKPNQPDPGVAMKTSQDPVSYRGASDWALNLRASGHGTLTNQGRSKPITVSEGALERSACTC